MFFDSAKGLRGKLRSALFCSLMGLFFGGAPAARALTFNVSYDSSVTSLTNAAQVEAAFNYATAVITNTFTNQITIYLGVYWGATGPFTNGVGLGSSSANLVGTNAGDYLFSYAEITNALHSLRNSADDSNSVASLTANDPLGTNQWWLPMAEARALRCFPATGTNNTSAGWTGLDGEVGFGNYTYTFSPTNRAVPGAYDFIAVAEHEITEVMGRTAGLNRFGDGLYLPFDLFRYTNSSGRSTNVNNLGVYFSVNKGTTALKMFYTNENFGDIQDWLGSSQPDAYDAFAPTGSSGMLSPADFTALDVLGYNSPLPTTNIVIASFARTNGGVQIGFTNTPGATFSVLYSTNLALAITNWTFLGNPTQGTSGHFYYVDTLYPSGHSRFYRVRAP
jgi:hypothetical protein